MENESVILNKDDVKRQLSVLAKQIAEIEREQEILSHKRDAAAKLQDYFKGAKPHSEDIVCRMAATKLYGYFCARISEKQGDNVRVRTSKVKLQQVLDKQDSDPYETNY